MPLYQGQYDPAIEVAGGYYKPNSIQYANNAVTAAPGLEIAGGSASPAVDTKNGFSMRVQDTFGVPVSAAATFALNGGNLADGYCRMYTFLCNVNTTTAATTLSTIFGADFTKHRPAVVSDVNLGDGSQAIVGYLYLKNETGSPFIPGTTNIDASGMTFSFADQYGYLATVPTITH